MDICEPHRKPLVRHWFYIACAYFGRCLEMGLHVTVYTFIKKCTFCIDLVHKFCCGEMLDLNARVLQLTHLRIRITSKATSRIPEIKHHQLESHIDLSNTLPSNPGFPSDAFKCLPVCYALSDSRMKYEVRKCLIYV
jgi:hypothetical protein